VNVEILTVLKTMTFWKFRKLAQIVAQSYSNCKNTKKVFINNLHYIKRNKKKFWQTKLPTSLNPTITKLQKPSFGAISLSTKK
jgi:hypothetical protein